MSYMPESLAQLKGDRERRDTERVPLGLLLNELVGERMNRAMAVNVSPTGLYLDRLFGNRQLQLGREERTVQLEFTLPSSSESIWALAEVCFDNVNSVRDDLVVMHGTGVRFLAMAKKHERLIVDFVTEKKRRMLEELLLRVQSRRRVDRRRSYERRAA
jgi:c-di-GMP-binding flagellar brake protein YcgR